MWLYLYCSWIEAGYEVNTESAELISEVNAYLVDNLFSPHLFIATNNLQTPCEIDLMGENANEDFVSTTDWEFVPDIEEAELIFERLWEGRDAWLKMGDGSNRSFISSCSPICTLNDLPQVLQGHSVR